MVTHVYLADLINSLRAAADTTTQCMMDAARRAVGALNVSESIVASANEVCPEQHTGIMKLRSDCQTEFHMFIFFLTEKVFRTCSVCCLPLK